MIQIHGKIILSMEFKSIIKTQNSSTLQQNVFLVMKISEEIFFVAKNTA